MIERSAGLPTGTGWIVGGGHTGATYDLDATVREAARTLETAYGRDVVIRFNTDRRSGGAWVKTDDPDGIWLNAEIGICADLVTAERNRRMTERYPDYEPRPPGIYLCAHVGGRVGEKAHVPVGTIADALAYVQANADLSRLGA